MENFSVVIEPGHYDWMTEECTSSELDPENAGQLTLPPWSLSRSLQPEATGVLIIDDNRLNGASIRRSLGALQMSKPIFEVRTCDEALDALCGLHSRIKVLPPCVLVLNIDMPGSFEFLSELRTRF